MGCWTNVHLNDNCKMGEYLIGSGELDRLSEKWVDSYEMFDECLQPVAEKYNLLQDSFTGYDFLFPKDILIKERENIKFTWETKPDWIDGVIEYMNKYNLYDIWLGIDF